MSPALVNPVHRNPLTCPHCYSKQIVRYGTLTLKHSRVQRFRCNTCRRTFTDKDTKHRTYPLKTILAAITAYNTGHTLAGACKETARRYHKKIPLSTLHSWVRDFRSICTFARIRKEALQLCGNGALILTRKLYHTQLYLFQLHRAKLELQGDELSRRSHASLSDYLQRVPTRQFPHQLFREDAPRSSQIQFSLLKTRIRTKHNPANVLTSLAKEFAKTNKERHQAVQDFFMANDSCTVAAEVPVYLTAEDIRHYKRSGFTLDLQQRKPVTGHIDLLQIRNGLIRILDYKPAAKKVRPLQQLTTYALALASRTRLPLRDFSCAWFDDRNYYEFFPLQAVYRLRKTN